MDEIQIKKEYKTKNKTKSTEVGVKISQSFLSLIPSSSLIFWRSAFQDRKKYVVVIEN